MGNDYKSRFSGEEFDDAVDWIKAKANVGLLKLETSLQAFVNKAIKLLSLTLSPTNVRIGYTTNDSTANSVTIPSATKSLAGVMSAEDKTRLDKVFEIVGDEGGGTLGELKEEIEGVASDLEEVKKEIMPVEFSYVKGISPSEGSKFYYTTYKPYKFEIGKRYRVELEGLIGNATQLGLIAQNSTIDNSRQQLGMNFDEGAKEFVVTEKNTGGKGYDEVQVMFYASPVSTTTIGIKIAITACDTLYDNVLLNSEGIEDVRGEMQGFTNELTELANNTVGNVVGLVSDGIKYYQSGEVAFSVEKIIDVDYREGEVLRTEILFVNDTTILGDPIAKGDMWQVLGYPKGGGSREHICSNPPEMSVVPKGTIHSSYDVLTKDYERIAIVYKAKKDCEIKVSLYKGDSMRGQIEQKADGEDLRNLELKFGKEYNLTFPAINLIEFDSPSLKKGVKYSFTLASLDMDMTEFNHFDVVGVNAQGGRTKIAVQRGALGTIEHICAQDYVRLQAELYNFTTLTESYHATLIIKEKYNDYSDEEFNALKNRVTTNEGNISTMGNDIETLKGKVERGWTIPDKSVGIPQLTDEVVEMLGSGGGGSGGGYMPDGEDLTLRGGKLGFRDTLATDANVAVGYHYVRRNVVSGKNVLTASMLQANAINIIKYEYDCSDATIAIPSGVTLRFEGGRINNATLTGNNTVVEGVKSCCFKNVHLRGSFKTTKWEVEWFGDCTGDCSPVIYDGLNTLNEYYFSNTDLKKRASVLGAIALHFSSGVYNCNTPIKLYEQRSAKNSNRDYLALEGEVGTVINNNVDNTNFTGTSVTDLKNVTYLFELGSYDYETRGFSKIYLNNIMVNGTGKAKNCGFLKVRSKEVLHPTTGEKMTSTWIEKSVIMNCTFADEANHIYFERSCYWQRIIGNSFKNAQMGVWIVDGNSSSITDNFFEHNVRQLFIDGGSGINITGNDLSGGKEGLVIMSGSSGEGLQCHNINVTGNYFEPDASISGSRAIVIGESAKANQRYVGLNIQCNTPGIYAYISGTSILPSTGTVVMYGVFVDCHFECVIDPHFGVGSRGNTGKLYYLPTKVDAKTKLDPFFAWYVNESGENGEMVIPTYVQVKS